MPAKPPATQPLAPAPQLARQRFIYLACPWTPKGGGMFKVADYLLQAQSPVQEPADASQGGVHSSAGAATLRPLDTRGSGHALSSLGVLLKALVLLLRGRASGQLAGVHVNMAERLSLLRKGTLVAACRLLGVPVVLHLHAAQLHHFYRRLPAPLRGLTRWVFSLATSVVVLGTASKRFVTQELGVPSSRVEIVINGVPAPSVARRAATGAVLQLLFVGNLSGRKGVPELLQAMAEPALAALPLKLTLVGGGNAASYEAQAQALGLDAERVQFAGWAGQAAVARHMAAADMLILPSYDEGLPLVILEALANGVAVVCTPVGEIPSVLQDGDNALLVAPGDVAALATALHRLATDDALRTRLERNGRALYVQHFSLSRFFAAVARIHKRHFGVAAQPAWTPTPVAAESPAPGSAEPAGLHRPSKASATARPTADLEAQP